MKKETGDKAAILSVCKYYKGEKKNPFDWDKENAANNFWDYEQQFFHNYETGLITGDVKVEFRKFLDDLFRHLADRQSFFFFALAKSKSAKLHSSAK